MRVTKKDIDNLNVLASASKFNINETKEVIHLYKERRIERAETAKYIIDKLSSKGEKWQQIGLNKLSYY